MNRLSVINCLLVLATILDVGQNFVTGEQESMPHFFHLTYSPTRLVPSITKALALRCESNPMATIKPSVRKVTKIRIVKKTSEDEWQLIATQADSGGPTFSNDKISVSARVIPLVVGAAFMEISWPVVDADTFGVYRCDVMGTDENNNSDVEMTNEVELKQSEVPSEDIVSLLIETKRDIEAQIMKNAKEIGALVKQKISLEPDYDRHKPLFIEEFLARRTAIAWPEGEYALLQPQTGCPVDLAFFGGNSGYARLHTESTDDDNGNKLHAMSHLSTPTITKSGSNVFLYLRFCVVTRVFSDVPWPEGSYCMHSKGDHCPDEFDHGMISLDTEDHQNADMYGGNVPFTPVSDLRFCCRSSSNSHDYPMRLPTENPFYLYRLRGQCQQVRDMNVLEEFMEIHTESFVNQNNRMGMFPDSVLGNEGKVRIELCYYSKK